MMGLLLRGLQNTQDSVHHSQNSCYIPESVFGRCFIMEAAGLALAILLLRLNQLDNYVQGLKTLGDFRNRGYRRTLEGYLTRLGNEHTFFINTIERSLEGVIEYRDGIESDKVGQLKELWEKPGLQSMLQEKLGS